MISSQNLRSHQVHLQYLLFTNLQYRWNRDHMLSVITQWVTELTLVGSR